MQPQPPEKKDGKLTKATKIRKALSDAPPIVIGNVQEDKPTDDKADAIPPSAD